MKKRILSVLLVLAMAVGMLTACGKAEAEKKELQKVVVSEFRGISWAAAYVAEAQGFYEEEGLEIEWVMYDDGPVAFQGMHVGDSDFCLLSQEPVLKAQLEGLESTFVYSVLDTRLYGFVSEAGITDVADLKGKTIFAGMQGSAPYSFVCSILREAGLDPEKDVTFVNMDYGASMAAMQAGQIQASYINTDNRVEIKDMDVNVLVDTKEPEDAAKYLKSEVFPGEIICATSKFVDENPEIVQSYVNAISKATEWMNENSAEDVAKAIAPYFAGMTEEVLAEKIAITQTALTKTGMIDKEPEMAVQNFCIGNGVIPEQIPYEDMVDMTFVQTYQKNK